MHTAQPHDHGNMSHLRESDAFVTILHNYISRRTLLLGSMAGAALTASRALLPRGVAAVTGVGFTPLAHSREDRLMLPEGYDHSIVVRWGDPLGAGAPAFDPSTQAAWKQACQFGYNCDFVGFLPLPLETRDFSHGLLVVNNEYTDGALMFPEWDGKIDSKTVEMVNIELAAHGVSIVEVQRDAAGAWSYVPRSAYSRRLTAETPMVLSGPAAGHAWLRTAEDTSGLLVRGTLNNCAGGVTPWGTVLTCEENFHGYFGGPLEAVQDEAVRVLHTRYGIKDHYGWLRHHARFDVSKEPHEPLRFGWVVEIDPYDPQSVPVKRTALGRFKHEAATVVITPGGQAVVYSGDDERFEYLYKFVSAGRYNPANRTANMQLLDAGTLYVARFRDDGTGIWLPLIFGQGPLTPANGFTSQAEVLINARYAADLLGATKMDRPEDVEVNPKTGKVYAVMTNNTRRKPDQVDAANPRADNKYGHILEMVEDGEHATASFRWDLFMACGNPALPEHRAVYQGHTDGSWLAAPDNIAFDETGRLWIATDGQPGTIAANDGVYVVDTEGPQRGRPRLFLSGLLGCEVCGPAFTPDCRTFFVAIQHPGESQESTFAQPASRWPDQQADMPPRPSVVAIYRQDGGKVGA
jgi:secreted PhoX family phosphatase